MNTPTPHLIHEDQIRQQVRDRYGAIARSEETDCGCPPSCCLPAASPTAPEKLGYQSGEAESVAPVAEMGLGCGNPTAIASIQAGETVVDLGSGGGFDCFLDAPPLSILPIDLPPIAPHETLPDH